MNRPARLGAALLLTALAAAGLRGAERAKFSLAALRRDGVMIPFASFDGRGWSVQWPESDVSVPLPISRDDIPKKWWGPQGPETPWRALLPGGQPRPLTLGKPVHAKVFCSGHPAIATDYRGDPIDPREPTVPKDGLAVSGDVKVDEILSISVHAPEAKRVIALITGEFNKRRAAASTSWLMHSPARSGRVPIELRRSTARGYDTRGGGRHLRRGIRRFARGDRLRLITFVRG
jgi:hypothetical protein